MAYGLSNSHVTDDVIGHVTPKVLWGYPGDSLASCCQCFCLANTYSFTAHHLD